MAVERRLLHSAKNLKLAYLAYTGLNGPTNQSADLSRHLILAGVLRHIDRYRVLLPRVGEFQYAFVGELHFHEQLPGAIEDPDGREHLVIFPNLIILKEHLLSGADAVAGSQ